MQDIATCMERRLISSGGELSVPLSEELDALLSALDEPSKVVGVTVDTDNGPSEVGA